MFSHALYNVVHIVGLVLAMAGLGGSAFLAVATGGQTPGNARRLAAAFHGLGLFLLLLGGFGMLARLGIAQGSTWPGWAYGKLGVWIVLGALAFLPRRFPSTAKLVLLVLPILGGLATYLAVYKPL